MLDFSDSRWSHLAGGRRTSFDPRRALGRLEAGTTVEQAWSELWDGLHNQGDVDTASYASVPHLVRIHRRRDVPDWNTYALLGAIERQRRNPRNPPIPGWLANDYDDAWRDLIDLALRDLARSQDRRLVQAALGAIAMARGLHRAAEVLLDFTEDELDEMVSQYRNEAR